MREIRLGVGHGRPGSGHVALVDDWRFELVGQFAWWAHTNKGLVYARREYHDATGEHGQYMHNLIMGFKGVDHRNHNGLDNQEHNLRAAGQGPNSANMRGKPGTSQYKGVHWNGRFWIAQICVNYQKRYLGRFADEAEAARAYDAAAREAFGEFSWCNFSDKDGNDSN